MKSISIALRSYTEEERKTLVSGLCNEIVYFIADEESEYFRRKEFRTTSTDKERVFLSDIMYGVVCQMITSEDEELQTAINTAELIADIMYERMFGRELQGYLSFYCPLKKFFDDLKYNKEEIGHE